MLRPSGSIAPEAPLSHALDAVGRTPVVELRLPEHELVRVRTHLEFSNPTGSSKDRAASYILQQELTRGRLRPGSRIIESSSGNFAVSLAAYARRYGLDFTSVIDPRINRINEWLVRASGANVVKVSEPDGSGGFLKTRLRTVKEEVASNPDLYWVNQYENPLNAEAYYVGLGEEMCATSRLDYVCLCVSSGGTITGVSKRVRERHPRALVIAVDTVGSVIFGGAPGARLIPGVGSSIRPKILESAHIDDVVMVDEVTMVRTCRELHERYGILAGGSSGLVMAAISRYFTLHPPSEPVVAATIFADRGDRYLETIHNPSWFANFIASSVAPPSA
jgi:N-(2-amino-2-carboxyethyl)-L-glutamate synthase